MLMGGRAAEELTCEAVRWVGAGVGGGRAFWGRGGEGGGGRRRQ